MNPHRWQRVRAIVDASGHGTGGPKGTCAIEIFKHSSSQYLIRQNT